MPKTLLLVFCLLTLFPACAISSVLPENWDGWQREAVRFDKNNKGARLDCNYQNNSSKRTLRVSITTNQKDIEYGNRKVKSFANPNYLAVMNSFPGADMRTWKKDGADFIFEARQGAVTRLTVIHHKFVLHLNEAEVDKDKFEKLIDKFEVKNMEAWANAPYDPSSGQKPAPIVGAGGEDEEEEMDEDNSAPKSLADWLPTIEGWKKYTSKSVSVSSAAVYKASDGTTVQLRLSAIAPEVQALLPMINTLSSSPMMMKHQSRRGSYALSIEESHGFKTLFKFSKNIGARNSTITATNGKVSVHLSAKRRKDEQLKAIYKAVDLESLGKAYPAN